MIGFAAWLGHRTGIDIGGEDRGGRATKWTSLTRAGWFLWAGIIENLVADGDGARCGGESRHLSSAPLD